MKKCQKCGFITDKDNARFCKRCGTAYVTEAVSDNDAIIDVSTEEVASQPSLKENEVEADVLPINKKAADSSSSFSEEAHEEVAKAEEEEQQSLAQLSSTIDYGESNPESGYCGFFKAIKVCYKRTFNYSGRASRSEFWWFWLYGVMVLFLFVVAAVNDNEVLGLLMFGLFLINIFPGISVRVRRLHDVGSSGWWLLGWAIGLIRIYLFFRFMYGSEYGENDYGPAPRYENE